MIGGNFMKLVTLVLRVRQVCCHSSLVPDEILEEAIAGLSLLAKRGDEGLSKAEAKGLLDRLNGVFTDNVTDECKACEEILQPQQVSIINTCSHVFCAPCLNKVKDNLCPTCKTTFCAEDIVSKEKADQFVIAKKNKASSVRSPKVQAMINLMGK